MALLPDPINGLYKPHAWIFPYLLDWGPCGRDVTHFRLYTTVLRWFDRGDRDRALRHAESYIDPRKILNDDRTLTNLGDLLASDADVGPWLAPGPFCRWLQDLADGDLIAGGKLSDRVEPEIADALPGFAWALDRWRLHNPHTPFPYPFWLWPKPE